jgi:hypothetical protein
VDAAGVSVRVADGPSFFVQSAFQLIRSDLPLIGTMGDLMQNAVAGCDCQRGVPLELCVSVLS